jgi:hypothetical protein
MFLFDRKPKIKKVIFKKDYSIKIAHLPDFHINGISDIDYREVLDTVLKEEPDLIVYNGDILNNYYKADNNIIKNLNLKCKYGSYFVTGNREGYYWNGKEKNKNFKKCINFLESNSLKELKHINIEGVDIYGVRDYHSNNTGFMKDIALLNDLGICNSIIICHNPIIQKYIDFKKCQNNIILSGHTHGGQIFPFGYIKLEKELRKFDIKRRGKHNLIGNNEIFIGNGVGYNHSKFRIFANNYIDMIFI